MTRNYPAADLGLEGALLAGILGGYVTGLFSGVLISLPAMYRGELLTMPLLAAVGVLGGVLRDLAPNPEEIWRFSPFFDLNIYRFFKESRDYRRTAFHLEFFAGILAAEFLRQTLGAAFFSLKDIFFLQPAGKNPPPPTLALPTTVAIDEVAVANMEWAIGTNSGRITGLTFGYAGSPIAHHVERLSLVLPSGTFTGSASIDAQPPFAMKGSLAFDGDVQRQRAHADIALSGTLDAVGLDASGRAGDARFALHARLTPLAAATPARVSPRRSRWLPSFFWAR
jgi:hypothetical protein